MQVRFVLGLHKQSGSSLMLAVFILVVMSLLASALMKMLSSSHESVVVEVYGTRALMAANTGVELMVSRIFPINATALVESDLVQNACGDLSSNPLTGALPNNSGMTHCSYNVSCTDTVVQVDGSDVRFYRFNSVGSCEFDDWTSVRQVQVEAKTVL